MMFVFEGGSADEAWTAAADRLLHDADADRQDSRCGATRELLHVGLVIRNPRQRWVVSRRPAPNPAFAIAEGLWIFAGRNDAAFPNFWNPVLPKYQGDLPTYHGAYGYRLRHAFGLDQIERAYAALAANPTTRQVVLGIYHPALDLPAADGVPVSQDVPCNVCSLLKIRHGKLEWVQIMRSNDLIRGLPYNIVQFTTLQEVMAGWLGLEVGTYTHFSDSLHVYESDTATFESSGDAAVPPSEDRLDLPRNEWDAVFAQMLDAAERIRSESLTHDEFRRVVLGARLPPGYRNLLLIVAADAARRKGWSTLTTEALDRCTNPLLLHAYSLWTREAGRRIGAGKDAERQARPPA
ncbi:MAG: thymidylate synthase [Thermoanaerobaculia bacterium]|nr:thymidylate synthase [Thermoanaerobaculia bacterium]